MTDEQKPTRHGADYLIAPESLPVASAEARATAPLLVGSLEDVARTRLFTVSSDSLLVKVAAQLSSAQISVIVVCDSQGAGLGVITETVLVHQLGLGHADFFATQARDVMTLEFTTCTLEDLLSDVLTMMHARGLIHVVVVGPDKRPIGVLNARDGLRALLAAGNQEEAFLRNYVMGMGYQ